MSEAYEYFESSQSDENEWERRAACASEDPELFFAPDRERSEDRERRQAKAKEICGRCAVRRECGESAIQTHKVYGIWGGMTETEIKIILRNLRTNGSQ